MHPAQLTFCLLSLCSALSAEEAASSTGAEPASPGSQPGLKPQLRYDRQTQGILQAWSPLMDASRKATVVIQRKGKRLALGCAVHENGL
mgnify:CR=1 FL=1